MVEITDCPLCGSRSFSHLLEGKERLLPGRESFSVVRCRCCGLCLTSPRPDLPELMRYYPASYEPWQRNDHWIYSIYYRLTRRLPLQEGARVLDIGCGSGPFLSHLAKRGMEAYGCDPGASVTSPRIRFSKGTLEEAGYPSDFFDLAVAWHLLEHVWDPSRTLKEVFRILKKDGRFLLSVPNVRGLELRLMGRASLLLDVPRHLTHFSPQTLEAFVTQAGFAIEKRRSDLFMPGPWIRSFFYLLEDRFGFQCPDRTIERLAVIGLPISICLNLFSSLIGGGNLLVWTLRKKAA